ncbi:hypothetical protein QJS83_14935 [Bdellovibrio sp. 22V]|uniref:hypothetical protein n=1 Tax=Bdellovibrio sp. 22V TaxID=3044166 RepID=UPI002542BFE4|nr:hypothetical protein [Bdellovibrio sp. 22V]WII71758.1 hypothetical protein QJS83_14935 [Bdellovibrio sp. 22V]
MTDSKLDLIKITGFDSYCDGAPHDYNPYQHGSPEFRAWSDGWYDAAKQYSSPHDGFSGLISAVITVIVFIAVIVVSVVSLINFIFEV